MNRLLTYLKNLFVRKRCDNCRYCSLLHVNKPIYIQYIQSYRRSKKKKIKRDLVGFSQYTSIDCKHPETQDKWAPYLRDVDYLLMEKPFKCLYWKRKRGLK